LKASHVLPEPVLTYSSCLNPISCISTFFRSSISACAFLGSFGFAGGGAFPPFFLISSAAIASSSCFFFSSS
jgi:hypothetical protein